MHPATWTVGHAGSLAVAVLGTDAVLAGLPATAVQLAHACLRAGYDLAVPASWGDELVATECLRALDGRSPRPVVMCTCPLVRRELLSAGPDLTPMLVTVVPPPVAAARYVRALFGRDRVHVTYVGACPGGDHPEIDARVEPTEFLAALADRGIIPSNEPTVFDSIIPPDRRRYVSLPGGPPSPEHLWSGAQARSLVELDGDNVRDELAQRLLSHECALIDLAPALGCACSGVAPGILPRRGRAAAGATEPPRALSAVIDAGVMVELADPVCEDETPQRPDRLVAEHAGSIGVSANESIAASSASRRRSPAKGLRAIHGTVPLARVNGRSLPRAYVSRRRAVPEEHEQSVTAESGSPHPVDRAPVSVPAGNGRAKPRSRGGSAVRAKTETGAHPPVVAAGAQRPDRMGDGPRS